jgi:hypothetical protein
MVKRALLIGIEYINTENYLPGCKKDVLLFKQLLTKRLGFEEENITILTDNHTDRLYDLPTGQNIYNHLNTLCNTNLNDDLTFIYYSGHGTQVFDTNNDEVDQKDEAIVPMDFRKNGVIIDDLINSILRSSSSKTIMFFDCCHSGTITDLPFHWHEKNNAISTFEKTENIGSYFHDNKYIYKLSACLDSQESVSISFDRKEYVGLFSKNLYFAILNSPDLESLNLFKVANYINRQVINLGLWQTVNISSSNEFCENISFSNLFDLGDISNVNEATQIDENLSSKIIELENTIQTLNNKIDNLNTENNLIKNSYDNKLNELSELYRYCDHLEKNLNEKTIKIKELNNQIKNKNKEIDTLNNKNAAYEINSKVQTALYNNIAKKMISKKLLSSL